jgi:hypothetical protein
MRVANCVLLVDDDDRFGASEQLIEVRIRERSKLITLKLSDYDSGCRRVVATPSSLGPSAL